MARRVSAEATECGSAGPNGDCVGASARDLGDSLSCVPILSYNGGDEAPDFRDYGVPGDGGTICARGGSADSGGEERANFVIAAKNDFRGPGDDRGFGCEWKADTGSDRRFFEWRSRHDKFDG